MKPPGITVHFTQTETTKSKRCSWESLKKQLKVPWKQAQKPLEYSQDTSSQVQIVAFQDGGSHSQVKCWWMPYRKRESAYKAKNMCPKEPAQRTEIHFFKIWSWASLRAMKEWSSTAEMVFLHLQWHLSGLHMPWLLKSRRHCGDLSCQGVALMPRDWKVPPGTAGLFSCCPCHRQEASASPANLPLLQSSQFPHEKGMDLTGLTFSI